MDYYKILEVSENVEISEIKKKYRKLAMKYHPDRNTGDEKAVKKYGELEYNQSFCFVPLLGLGGKKSVDNLDKGDTLTHIYLITELVGKVGIDD